MNSESADANRTHAREWIGSVHKTLCTLQAKVSVSSNWVYPHNIANFLNNSMGTWFNPNMALFSIILTKKQSVARAKKFC